MVTRYTDYVTVDVSVDTDGLNNKLDELEEHDHDGTYASVDHTHDEFDHDYVTDDRLDEVVSEKIRDTMIEGYVSRTDFNDLSASMGDLDSTLSEVGVTLAALRERVRVLEDERDHEHEKDVRIVTLLRELIEAILRRA